MADETSTPTPPVARKVPAADTRHGHTRVDDYAWLRDDNWQQVMRDPSVLRPDIRDYLEAENTFTEAAMGDTEALQAELFAEMRGRIKEDDSSVPATDGPHAYGTRYLTGAEHPQIIRTPRDGGEAEVLLDGDALATDHAYFQLGGFGHSPDHRLLAWAADTQGSEYFTVRVRDLDTGADLDDEVPNTGGGVVWEADGSAFYYVQVDDNHRPSKVFRHILGTSSADDVLLHDGDDPRYFVGVGQTQSRRFLMIDSHDHETSEALVLDMENPAAGLKLIAERKAREEYQVEHNGERFFILTNAGDAEDFKIVTAPVDRPGRENWTDLVPHRQGRLIVGFTLLRDWLVRLEREDGLPRIVVRRLDTGDEHEIAFAEEAYSLGLAGGFEFATDSLRFTYSSMTSPARVYDYDMTTRERLLRKEQEVPSGHDPSDYVTRRIHAPAADGETVPISVLYRKGTPLDGSAPCLLYGYGAYGIAIPASFSTSRLSLVDRGFIYAIAHIRGGKDKGYRWYRDGRREKKTNTFKDFISAAEFMVNEGLTRHDRLVGWGGSAGGLLIGAVANMAPERFAGLIAEVPFVDTLTTMLDDTLPLTPPEWPEWGNPIESAEDYATIAAYSPYDNVVAKAYPAILALAGLSDPRVTYWEPAKWIARLRAMRTDSRLTVLKTNMDAGHGGASGRFQRLQETALATAFALKAVGRA